MNQLYRGIILNFTKVVSRKSIGIKTKPLQITNLQGFTLLKILGSLAKEG